MDGLILVDKPPDYTSHTIVKEIRKYIKGKKVGHYGTLDPLATGLIIIAVGKATKLFPFFSKTDKAYFGKIKLGYSTDTYDAHGQTVSPPQEEFPSLEELLKSMKKFKGAIDQIPPPFSAKKYQGKPLYTLARQKKYIELKPSKVYVYSFQLKDYSPPFVSFKIKCSSGTYIRSIAHNLGQQLGCGAHLCHLCRTEVGNFHLKDAHSLEKIKTLAEQAKFDEFLIPLEFLLPQFPKIILTPEGASLAKNGNLIYPEKIIKILTSQESSLNSKKEKEDIYRLFSLEGKLLALARKSTEKKCLHPFLVIDSGPDHNST